MSNNKSLILNKYQQFPVIILTMLIAGTNIANASDFNADAVMNKMNDQQRASYMMGLVDGLAYSRWQRDKPNEAGMKCIYDWYYRDNSALWKNTLAPVFTRYKHKPVTSILYVLTKKKCGE